MFIYIILLWVLLELGAPWWTYLLLAVATIARAIVWGTEKGGK